MSPRPLHPTLKPLKKIPIPGKQRFFIHNDEDSGETVPNGACFFLCPDLGRVRCGNCAEACGNKLSSCALGAHHKQARAQRLQFLRQLLTLLCFLLEEQVETLPCKPDYFFNSVESGL
jgi:hypothetical protein